MLFFQRPGSVLPSRGIPRPDCTPGRPEPLPPRALGPMQRLRRVRDTLRVRRVRRPVSGRRGSMRYDGGYAGAILHVDLTTRSHWVEPLPPELTRRFLGGAGINAALALELLEPRADAFAPENCMIFGLGPLVGTMVPGAGKGNVTARSPYGRFLGISGHGRFGALKYAGYDHLVITGRAERPTVVSVADDRVTFLDATDPVSYTHLRAHETKANLVCRLLL